MTRDDLETIAHHSTSSDGIDRELARVLLVIDARHRPSDLLRSYGPVCVQCGFTWPCPDHLTIHPEDPRAAAARSAAIRQQAEYITSGPQPEGGFK